MISPHDSMSGIVDDMRDRLLAPTEPKRCSKIAQMTAAAFPVFFWYAMGVGFIMAVWASDRELELPQWLEMATTLTIFVLLFSFWAGLVWASSSRSSINKGLRLLTKFYIASAIPLEGVALWSWAFTPDPSGAIFPSGLVLIMATFLTVQMVFYGVKFHRKLSREIYLEEHGDYDPMEVSRKTRMLAMALVMLGLGGIGGMHRIYAG